MHSFSVKGPKLWNMLPENIRMIDNYDQLKSKLKTFLFTNMNFYEVIFISIANVLLLTLLSISVFIIHVQCSRNYL